MRFLASLVVLTASACARPGSPPSAPAAAGSAAELLGEDVPSTGANEYNPSLSPDGRTLVFARSEPDFRNARIMVAELQDGRWGSPRPIAFADERFSDSDPTFAPDGQTLFFISNRPAEGRDSARADMDVWRVRRTGAGWGAPEHLGAGVNTPAQELGPAWHDGWLYFASTRGGRARMLDLFRAREAGSGFGPAEALEQWNTAASESDPEFSADGGALLFWSDRPGGRGEADVYASHRTAEGWSAARPLEGTINSPGFDFTPSFSPDGRWILFASTRGGAGDGGAAGNGQGDLYRIRRSAALP